jgi:glutamine amidotransferase
MKLAVVTSGGANFYSIEMALKRLNVDYELTTSANIINAADGVIFPGVGSASFAMSELKRHGLISVLQNYTKPLLGICLGMQLLYEYSAEGNVECLGIMPGKVNKFEVSDELPVPQMGWNNLTILKNSPIISGVNSNNDVYFVHSYFAPINEVTIAGCSYGTEFAAVAQKDNFYAMQFHPEKSGKIGELLLKNFIEVVNGNLSSD